MNLWCQVQERLEKERVQNETKYPLPTEPIFSDRYGNEYLTKPQLGQGSFRVAMTEAYQRGCAITGERTLPVLNASHIKPYAKDGPHDVSNGLLLREDLHTLFDWGYLTITNDYIIEVSHRLKSDYGNGKEYYEMQGRKLLVLPENQMELPSQEFITWHNDNVYVS
jgi:putative restriction endonuclease